MRRTVLVFIFFMFGCFAGLLLWQTPACRGLRATGITSSSGQIESQSPETPQKSRATWRRTADGWEKVTWETAQVPIRRPALHPTVVSLLQMLVAVLALLGFAEIANKR